VAEVFDLNRTRNWAYVAALFLVVGYLATNSQLRHGFGVSIAAFAKPLLIPIVEIILDPDFVYMTSSLIFVAAILSCILFYGKIVRPELRRMKALRDDIIRLIQLKSMRAVPHETPPSIETLGVSLQNLRLFAVPWVAFQKEIAVNDGVPAYPFSYFVVTDPSANEIEGDELMTSLPGYFVSIGLILTFSGLVVALYFAAKGFRSGNMEQSRDAILQLLNASAFKFLTSIAALGSALLLTIFYGFCSSLIQSGRASCVLAIESYVAEFRATETAARGAVRNGTQEVEAKIGMLCDRITKLNQEISRLSTSIASVSMVYAIEK
jgi:hypothetical protein